MEDTMRPEYDFSKGERGVTARRYAEKANVVATRVGEVGLYAFEACVVSRFVLVVQALFALTMKAPFVLFTRP